MTVFFIPGDAERAGLTNEGRRGPQIRVSLTSLRYCSGDNMRFTNLLVLFLLPIIVISPCVAQTPDSQAKRADIIRLLRMTGAAKGAAQAVDLMLPSLKQAMPQVPEQVWQEFRSEVREEDMIELTYEIWNKHFSHQEIRDLIRFYQSPTGLKIIRETPTIQEESLVAGQKWGNQIVNRILARLRDKGYQLPPELQQP
jgi:uncharacterized protein